jgi:hypothetical protein
VAGRLNGSISNHRGENIESLFDISKGSAYRVQHTVSPSIGKKARKSNDLHKALIKK